MKSGIWHLSQQCPTVPIIPVYMHGLGRAMGKGEKIPVPFFIDIYVDDPVIFHADKAEFKNTLLNRFIKLQQHATSKCL